MSFNAPSFKKIPKSYGPWKRKRDEVWVQGMKMICLDSFYEKFDSYTSANIDLDIDTKRAALKVSESIVSVVSTGGLKPMFPGSGTIIACENVGGAYVSKILTSGSILRSPVVADDIKDIKVVVYLSRGRSFEGQVVFYDCHYNISIIKIESDSPLPIASLRLVDDSISVDSCKIPCPWEKGVGSESYQFCQLCPGDLVIGIGRYFKGDFELMAAPGKFSLDACNFDCRELFRASCKISKCGIGGPLINRFGEVIGVNFYDQLCTPFLPINIASKCLEHFEKYRRFCRPWLGIKATSLYAASVAEKENVIRKFPPIGKGVIVEEVVPGSPCHCAGMLPDDVIVLCNRKFVRGFLEFFGMICDVAARKKKRPVELVVLRGKSGARAYLTIAVDEASPEKFYRWPLPEESMKCVSTYRRD